MKKIEVPKCIQNKRFNIAITDQNNKTSCSTKFISIGNVDLFGDEIYIFNENQLDNCAKTMFDTSKLTVKIETTDIHQGWAICKVKIEKGEEYSSNFYNPEAK